MPEDHNPTAVGLNTGVGLQQPWKGCAGPVVGIKSILYRPIIHGSGWAQAVVGGYDNKAQFQKLFDVLLT